MENIWSQIGQTLWKKMVSKTPNFYDKFYQVANNIPYTTLNIYTLLNVFTKHKQTKKQSLGGPHVYLKHLRGPIKQTLKNNS